MRLDDPALVREQYATEANLRARQAIYATREGPDAREVLWDAVVEARPRRVLEVGGGPGELSERILRELGADVRFVDISPRMVELARARGIDAEVGDVQELRFGDGDFDVAVAAWMLYHVPDLDRGLAELARVLRPGGRLVAVVNSETHLQELRRLFSLAIPSSITRETGAEILGRHFAAVERRDADGCLTIANRELVRAYTASMMPGRVARPEPEVEYDLPLRVRYAASIFVATT